jgi:hypothetical protein
MKVAVPDAERGFVLAGQLARFSAEVVGRDGDGGYEVALDEPSSQELPAVLALIERWIEDEHVDAARVQLDGRSYTMELNATR